MSQEIRKDEGVVHLYLNANDRNSLQCREEDVALNTSVLPIPNLLLLRLHAQIMERAHAIPYLIVYPLH